MGYTPDDLLKMISIHAPAKGATVYRAGGWILHSRFQSTLPRRERRHRSTAPNPNRSNFNPRSREGSDLSFQMFRHKYLISIHAPAKGATKYHKMHIFDERNFNPRSREGSDSNIIQQISFSLYNTVYFVSNNIK